MQFRSIVAATLLTVLTLCGSAAAQPVFQVLHSFTGAPGSNPSYTLSLARALGGPGYMGIR